MTDPFERMNKSIFARLGKDAFLRGLPCKIEISFGVEVVTGGDYSNVVSHRAVANIFYLGMAKPKMSDTIVVDGKSYKLDVLLKDDESSARWAVI